MTLSEDKAITVMTACETVGPTLYGVAALFFVAVAVTLLTVSK